MQARLFTHFLGFHMSMGLEYLEVVRPEKIVAKVTSFSPDRPMWTFTFEPAGSGTKLTVLGEWRIEGGGGEGLRGLTATVGRLCTHRGAVG